MSRPKNLVRRSSGTYYARIHVPLDLIELMDGKKQKWVSLATKDYDEAKRRLNVVLDEWAGVFADLRRRRSLTEADMMVAVHEHYTSKLAEGDRERVLRPAPSDIEDAMDVALEKLRNEQPDATALRTINAMTDVEVLAGKAHWAADRRRRRLARLRHDIGLGDFQLIEPDANAFLARKRFQIAKGGPEYRELCQRLMRAEIQQLEIYERRDQGSFGSEPSDPIIKEAAAVAAKLGEDAAAETHTIMGLFAKYEKENPNSIRPESLRQARRDVQHFADFAGSAAGPSKLTKAMVRNWKELLADFPVKASETNVFSGMPALDIVAKNKTLPQPKPTLTRQTVRRYMGSLSGLCTWLVSNDYIELNPVSGLMPKKAEPTNKRATFSDGALSVLFTSPLFTTAAGEAWPEVREHGRVAVRDHRYWIPWIMLLGGARPAEIAQLYLEDIRHEAGIWVMQIIDDDESDKRVKRGSSRRIVPIHSKLIELGFLEHAERMRAAGHQQVFPEVEIPREGQIAKQFSREFNRYLTDVGVKVDLLIVARN